MIQQKRLRRNLLSSQPLCFNLFGYLGEHPATLLPWVRQLSPDAEEVVDVALEWAPTDNALGGSAFDAFVEYTLPGRRRGFIGIECKYAENLAKAQPKPAPEKYKDSNASWSLDRWRRDRSRQASSPSVLVQPAPHPGSAGAS